MRRLYIKRTSNSEEQLKRHHEGDAGLDILSAEDFTIEPGQSHTFATDLYVALPWTCVGIVKARSGLSVKHSLEIGAGVIDSGYRGEVRVKLYNYGNDGYTVRSGDRIAQLLVVPIEFCQVIPVDELPNGDRASNGFGSTGK